MFVKKESVCVSCAESDATCEENVNSNEANRLKEREGARNSRG